MLTKKNISLGKQKLSIVEEGSYQSGHPNKQKQLGQTEAQSTHNGCFELVSVDQKEKEFTLSHSYSYPTKAKGF